MKREEIAKRNQFAKEQAERDAARELARGRPIPAQENRAEFNSAGEAQVVYGKQLAKILARWRMTYLLERNPVKERVSGTSNQSIVIGPAEWLALETGINVRRIRGMINGEYRTVSLSDADKILQALGKEDLLRDVLYIIPNPNWSLEKWAEYLEERGCF